MFDYITGEKFIALADWKFYPNSPHTFGNFNPIAHTFDSSQIKDGDIIYTHTDLSNLLLEEVKKLGKEVILITHNSDNCVGPGTIIPDNVKKWYSTNVNCVNDKLVSIPIGLENGRWFRHTHKKVKMQMLLETDKKMKNLVYVNHNIATNEEEREEPYKLLVNKHWATTKFGMNGEDFDSYIRNVYNHEFVVCPQGNGMDTVRTWECLYLGTIPIEKRNINNQHYTDLPICFVNDWTEITEDFLLKELSRIKSMQWNLEKLTFEYWKNKICAK